MKKKLITGAISAVMLAVLLGVAACSGLGDSGGTARQLVSVTRGDLTVAVTGNGEVTASREARLTFGSGGKVSKMTVKVGDIVKAGDFLTSLDTRSLELSLQQAEVSLTQAEGTLVQAQLAQSTAEGTLEDLKDSGDSLQLALINAQIARDTAKINLNVGIAAVDYAAAEAELYRAKAWYKYIQGQLENVTEDTDTWYLALDNAKERLDVAQTNFDNALTGHDSNQVNLKKKQLEAAELSVTLAQKDIDDLDKNIALQELQVAATAQTVEQARQAVELARLSLEGAQEQLDEATITAPFDGVIASVLAEEGDIIPSVTMASTPVIQLVAPGFLELVISVDEIDIPSVEPGQEAEVEVDALPGTVFRGHVTAVYPVPEEEGGIVLYQVKLSLDVPKDSGIKVGMSASADIISAEHTGVLIVPGRAVTTNSQGQSVVMVSEDDEVQERPVIVGLDDGMNVEIVSGLSEGETVVVEVRARSSSGSSLFLGG